MKSKALLFVILFSFIASFSIAGECNKDKEDEKQPVAERFEKVVIVPKGAEVACPVTYQTMGCTVCHTNDWKLKEIDPKAQYSFPNLDTWIADGKGFYEINSGISSGTSKNFAEALAYFKRHNLDHVIILIDSPGGSLFDSWLIVGLIENAKRNGIIIETRCYSMAMSGAFMIFAAGSDGYRVASPMAEFMWHELINFELFAISTPSDKEDQARILRHLQDNINSWLSTRIKKSKDEIDVNVKKKEWWLTGKDALEVGLVDAFTNS